MFKWFKKEKKKTPKYLVHIVGTSDVGFVYEYKDLENTEYYDDSTADQVLLEVDDALVEDDGISDSDVDNLF